MHQNRNHFIEAESSIINAYLFIYFIPTAWSKSKTCLYWGDFKGNGNKLAKWCLFLCHSQARWVWKPIYSISHPTLAAPRSGLSTQVSPQFGSPRPGFKLHRVLSEFNDAYFRCRSVPHVDEGFMSVTVRQLRPLLERKAAKRKASHGLTNGGIRRGKSPNLRCICRLYELIYVWIPTPTYLKCANAFPICRIPGFDSTQQGKNDLSNLRW